MVGRLFTQRTTYPFAQPGMAPQPLRGTVTQHIGNSPPAERNADVCQRKRCSAKPALEGIIADTQIELPNAFRVQGGHRSLDDEPARRTVRPILSCVADAQEHK